MDAGRQGRDREPRGRHAGARAEDAHRGRRARTFVGVCLDSGNPVWTIEDPHLTLETLAPYVLTSHMRDSALWNTPEGAAVRWTRMGEGNMGMEDYIRTYIEKCPGKAVSLEVIVSGQPRDVQLPRSRSSGSSTRARRRGNSRGSWRSATRASRRSSRPADPAVTPQRAQPRQRRGEHQVDAGVSGRMSAAARARRSSMHRSSRSPSEAPLRSESTGPI